MTYVQVVGCFEEEDGVVGYVEDGSADFYGVYVGEPGSYQWAADFALKEDAIEFATRVADLHNYEFADDTYQ